MLFCGLLFQVLLPAPSIFEGLSEGEFSFPSEFFVDFLRIGIAGCNITWTTCADGMRNRDTCNPLECLDEFFDARSGTRSDIVDRRCFCESFFGKECFEGRDMRLGEVDHMDEVADPGAIRSRVIVPEDGQSRSVPGCNLGEIGDEIVGGSEGQFADESGVMCADRVEIAESG